MFTIETEWLTITEFTLDMAEDVHKNSLDEDNRRFVPDEVFETMLPLQSQCVCETEHLVTKFNEEA